MTVAAIMAALEAAGDRAVADAIARAADIPGIVAGVDFAGLRATGLRLTGAGLRDRAFGTRRVPRDPRIAGLGR